ncbi:hypothetical protein I6N95_21595 [Vagococcus sp. BWB3-3]|uniref:LPXTG cell wall anchor domain-containing protein n=1 Tax=Vagococcus allomyrinae TaxID=2794353 RepID=A0A940P9Q6_9ENTE|nr:hypothetical protein [Vagococcus allomyrinae]MBP1043625.1 hypothetical protein [Vagococcus allomyrinae]
MKKMLSMLLVALVAIGFALPASAAGAITAAEQSILNELNAGVTAGGGTFYFAASDIAQAENELKANDFDAATCQTVVGHIQAARALVVNNSAGLTATSLNNLLGQLPKAIQDQILDHIYAAADALDLAISSNGTVVNKAGKTVIVPTTKANPVVKATGANYTISFLVFGSLMVAALGAAVIGKKYSATAA